MTRDEVSMAEVNGRVKPLLANFIGKSDALWVNKLSGTVEENDRFLLGSDGLFKKLTYEDVEEETGKIRSGPAGAEGLRTPFEAGHGPG